MPAIRKSSSTTHDAGSWQRTGAPFGSLRRHRLRDTDGFSGSTADASWGARGNQTAPPSWADNDHPRTRPSTTFRDPAPARSSPRRAPRGRGFRGETPSNEDGFRQFVGAHRGPKSRNRRTSRSWLDGDDSSATSNAAPAAGPRHRSACRLTGPPRTAQHLADVANRGGTTGCRHGTEHLKTHNSGQPGTSSSSSKRKHSPGSSPPAWAVRRCRLQAAQ